VTANSTAAECNFPATVSLVEQGARGKSIAGQVAAFAAGGICLHARIWSHAATNSLFVAAGDMEANHRDLELAFATIGGCTLRGNAPQDAPRSSGHPHVERA
jgi:hypothetical protein